MAVFNTNQVRQLYVASAYTDLAKEGAKVTDVKTLGDIGLKVIDDGVAKELYFVYKGADTVLTSDRIQVKNLTHVKAVKAADLRRPFKTSIVALNPNVNEGKPIIGQDYILRIILTQWIGMSDEDKYFKECAVHATDAMNKDVNKFYNALVKSLNLCFSREVGATNDANPYLKFEAVTDAHTYIIDGEEVSVTGGIKITEKAQPWTLGIESQEPVLFEPQPTTVFVNGADEVWGVVKDETPSKDAVTVDGDNPTGLGNGKQIADLEYFCMGERGDQYRMIGWPNIIPTKYLVNPDTEYNVLDIHYAFTDEGINSYRSEKDLTIVAEDASVINSLVDAIKTATGLSIKTLE